MAIIDNMTNSLLSCQNSIFTTDIDIEEEIEYSCIFNTHRGRIQLNNVSSTVSTTENLFSDYMPTRVNERAQISIIDMYEQIPGEYQAFFVYEDLYSRYIILKPLKEASDTEIIKKLADIFFLFGAPKILQSNHGKGYIENLISKLRRIIPTLDIICGNVLRRNEHCKDFKKLVKLWQQNTPSMPLYEALNFIQAFENTSKISKSTNKKSHKTPAKIFFQSSIANNLVQLIRDKNSFDEVLIKKDDINKTIKNDFFIDCHEDFNAKVNIEISHEYEKNNKGNIVYTPVADRERFHNNETYESSMLTFITLNESIHRNDMKENIDSSSSSERQTKALVEIQKTVTIAKESVVSQKNIFKCNICNRICRKINHLKNHMRSHKPKLKVENNPKMIQLFSQIREQTI